jgi:UDP-N-acetylmuramate--alanine ligase
VWSGRRLHFVGIGGAGMSGLALVAHALGAQVSGSDREPYDGPLLALGITPVVGHDAANVPAGAEVVFSSAIAFDNPERAVASRELHRADLLGELTRLKPTIAVTGTHGKTTTSSMLVHAMRGAGMDPSYLVGGEVRSTGSNAGWGTGEWLVVEADESDRSLLKLSPTVAVLTNAELDHHTTSQRDVDATFSEFLGKARVAVVWDRPNLLALAGETYVVPFDAVPSLTVGGSRFELDGLPVELTVPGEHNARNAAAALLAAAVADEGVSEAIAGGGSLPWSARMRAAAASLRDFTGAGRRFERIGVTRSGAEVVDDYAHHPTEVAATLAAARTLAPRRVVAVFQPHLYSRTQREARAFGRALAAADLAVVVDVYPARERASDYPGVTGLLVAEAVADAAPGKRVVWMRERESALHFLSTELQEGDLLLTLGAGDIHKLGKTLVATA